MSFPRLTREQVRELDRRAVEEYGIPSIVLMENAARSVADSAMFMLQHIVPERSGPGRVLILCGAGNNGGDGYAVARHLHNRGCNVETSSTNVTALKGDAATNYHITKAMRLPNTPIEDADIPINGQYPDLIIDALFGTGLTRPIEGSMATFIERVVNPSKIPVLAVDVPSGMDCNTGIPLGACIRATRTITFVVSKKGFDHPNAMAYTGYISIGDIGVPRELIDAVLTS